MPESLADKLVKIEEADLMLDDLDRFYEVMKSGTSVDDFLHCHAAIFSFIHSAGLTPEYRLGSGRLKRLRDEITPVARYVRQSAALDDWIQFPLNSSTPDCNVWHRATQRHQTIEVTIIRGKERYYLKKELNDTGAGRGRIGVGDNQPKRKFENAMGKEPRMHSTDEEQIATAEAIALCVRKKTRSSGDLLLIEYDGINLLPKIRWLEIQSRLAQSVQTLRFSEIFLVGNGRDSNFCLRLR